MERFTLQQVKTFSPELLRRVIQRAKHFLMKDPVMLEVFSKYDVPIEDLKEIPICFADLDVSARTKHGIIFINYKLLCDGDFYKDYSYLIHEITHQLQQTTSDEALPSSDGEDYLDSPQEIEGFRNQIQWISEEFGSGEADKYLDRMLDYHELEGTEKNNKKEQLSAKV